MSTLDLRGIENGKIACADRLFEQLSGSGIYYEIEYDVQYFKMLSHSY